MVAFKWIIRMKIRIYMQFLVLRIGSFFIKWPLCISLIISNSLKKRKLYKVGLIYEKISKI